MNVFLSIIMITISALIVCNYVYRKIRGIPDKPLKEIWNEYKEEIQKVSESQKINSKFKREKEQKKDLDLKNFQTTSRETFTIKTSENKDIEIELTCTAGLIPIDENEHEEKTRKEFLYQCFPVTWENFLKLNKYDKILAYTVKNCNDICLLKEVYEQMFKYLRWQSELPEELKKDIRSRKRFLYEFSAPAEVKSRLGRRAYRYYDDFYMSKIPKGSYFVMNTSHRGDELSEALDNTYFLKNDSNIDIYYPPNYYNDVSRFAIIEPRFFKRQEYEKYKPFNRLDLKPHPDYDFNIPKYIVSHFLDMKSIVKDNPSKQNKRIFC